jgi:hypothetical protein
MFIQFRNCPFVIFNASGTGRSGFDRDIPLAEVVIREVEGNRSLKVFQLSAEWVREPGKASAMHSQRVVLFFNVRSRNAVNIWQPAHDRLFGFPKAGLRPTDQEAIHAEDTDGGMSGNQITTPPAGRAGSTAQESQGVCLCRR